MIEDLLYHPVAYVEFLCDQLDCDSDEIVFHPVMDEYDEIWGLDVIEGLEVHLDIENMTVPPVFEDNKLVDAGFAIGHVVIGTIKGQPFVADQNASPFGIFIKKEQQ